LLRRFAPRNDNGTVCHCELLLRRRLGNLKNMKAYNKFPKIDIFVIIKIRWHRTRNMWN